MKPTLSNGTNFRKKRTAITIETKRKILEAKRNGRSQQELSLIFDLTQSTISKILKNESKILSSSHDPNRKRVQEGYFPILDDEVLRWFHITRSMNIKISNEMLSSKAVELFEQLKETTPEYSDKKFTASQGWLTRFKNRHDLNKKQEIGESQSVDIPVELENSIDLEYKNSIDDLSKLYDKLDNDMRIIDDEESNDMFYDMSASKEFIEEVDEQIPTNEMLPSDDASLIQSFVIQDSSILSKDGDDTFDDYSEIPHFVTKKEGHQAYETLKNFILQSATDNNDVRRCYNDVESLKTMFEEAKRNAN